MKKKNQEIDCTEAVLAMRTMLSKNNAQAKLEMRDLVSFEVVDSNKIEKPLTKRN